MNLIQIVTWGVTNRDVLLLATTVVVLDFCGLDLFSGVDIRDEDIPAIKYFNKVALSSFVAYLTLFTFACIFMISGKNL